MEKLILLYCLLIALLLFSLLVLLLKEEKPQKEDSSGTSKWLLALVTPIVFMVLHLNILLLPWQREHQGEVVALGTMGILILCCALPLLYLLYTTFLPVSPYFQTKSKTKLKEAA